ncbi:MAG: DUF4249 family protein [Bacteroidia bacterium]|nr:DUF4249 family protein [Bacteroidia bacterium]
MRGIFYIALLIALCSCEKQIPLTKFDFTEKLVLTSYNNAGENIGLWVSHSVNSVSIPKLDDIDGMAKVLLKEDGNIVFFNTILIEKGRLDLPIAAKLGSEYEIEIEFEDYPPILAKDIVPTIQPNTNLNGLVEYGDKYKATFSIQDQFHEEFYLVELYVTGKQKVGLDSVYASFPVNFSSPDKVFLSNISTVSSTSNFGVFSDELFNGGARDISLIFSKSELDEPNFTPSNVKLRLSSISSTMFYYYMDLLENNHIYGGPLASYSFNTGNIEDGLGIFSFYSAALDSVSLK